MAGAIILIVVVARQWQVVVIEFIGRLRRFAIGRLNRTFVP